MMLILRVYLIVAVAVAVVLFDQIQADESGNGVEPSQAQQNGSPAPLAPQPGQIAPQAPQGKNASQLFGDLKAKMGEIGTSLKTQFKKSKTPQNGQQKEEEKKLSELFNELMGILRELVKQCTDKEQICGRMIDDKKTAAIKLAKELGPLLKKHKSQITNVLKPLSKKLKPFFETLFESEGSEASSDDSSDRSSISSGGSD